MKRIYDYIRVKKLIDEAIKSFNINLSEMNVLTEAASGNFIVTPLIAAMAGAKSVYAIAKDSRYGSVTEIKEYFDIWIEKLEIDKNIITVTDSPAYLFAEKTNIVTNLGAVRPINSQIINRLPVDSAISLMWETWEFREDEFDLQLCKTRNIPVLGTSETYPSLDIFRYVALLSLKLLFEVNIEVSRTNILLIGSPPFGLETKSILQINGANVFYLDPLGSWKPNDNKIKDFLTICDAIVLVENNSHNCLLGGDKGIPLEWIDNKDIKVVHICGHIDYEEMNNLNIIKHPPHEVKQGFMSLTTDYLGPKPVIDLHSAGLKVGESLVNGMRLFNDSNKAIEYALNNSPAMDFINKD